MGAWRAQMHNQQLFRFQVNRPARPLASTAGMNPAIYQGNLYACGSIGRSLLVFIYSRRCLAAVQLAYPDPDLVSHLQGTTGLAHEIKS